MAYKENSKDIDHQDLQVILDGLARVLRGDFSTKIKISGKNPDFASIAESYNEMLKGIRNITDSARDSYRQLEHINKRLTRIFEASNDIILQVNMYGTIIDVNLGVEIILGYKRDDLKGKHFAKSGAIPDKNISKLVGLFKQAVTSGKAADVIELELKTINGDLLCMEASTKLIRTEDKIEGAVVILRNITRHVQADEALREQKERLHSIIASMDDFIFVIDNDMCLVEYHPSREHSDPSMYSKPDEHVGKPLKDIFPSRVAHDFEKILRICMKKDESQNFDYPWTLPGVTLWYSARFSPLHDKNGTVAGVTVVLRDITARKKAEKALEESEKKYRHIFENSPQGFVLLDVEGRIIDVNKRICDWLGYEREEMIGKDHILYPFLTKSGKVLAMKKFFQRLSGKVLPPYHLEFITKKGEIFLGEVLAMQIRDEQGKIAQIIVMIADVTDRTAPGHAPSKDT